MRVLVTGSRDWTKENVIQEELRALIPIDLLIFGDATGVDEIAWRAAEELRIPYLRIQANWAKYGKAAGPLRNAEMLERGRPSLVLAFHEDLQHSKGTKDMVKQAKATKIPVKLIV